jgi:branched-chain amino acid transport system substrate-binding protein
LSSLSVFSGAGALWVTDGSTRLLRVDPESGDFKALDVREPLDDVTVGAGGVWAISGRAASVFQIDTQGRTVKGRIRIVNRLGGTAPFPFAVAVGEGSVWVLNGNTQTVSRIDPEFGGVTATIPLGVGSNPSSIAVGKGAAWVANSGAGTLVRIDTETNAPSAIPVGGSAAGVAVGGDRVWVTVQPGFRLESGLVSSGTQAGRSAVGVPAISTSFCQPVFFGGKGKPQYLIASDLPFQSIDAVEQTLQMSDAIRFVLAKRGFTAGKYSIGFQSCDDSTAQARTWTPETCRRNARAYARQANLLGVIGTYNSGCSQLEIPILGAAPGGPVATVSSASTYIGLTRSGPGSEPGEPGKYYPRGVRNFTRVVPADHIQGAANAMLAKRLGIARLYVLHDGTIYGVGLAGSVRQAANKLGIEVAGVERWEARARSYAPLARRIDDARADAVFLGGLIDLNGAALVRDLKTGLRRGVRILASDGFVPVPLLIQGAGPAAEGVLVTFAGVAPSRLGKAGRQFVAEFEQAVGGAVSPYAIATAQAAEVLLDAIGRSDGTRASVVRELFKTRVENGILGTFSFDRNGDTTAGSVTIFRVENGKEKVFAVITPPRSLVR